MQERSILESITALDRKEVSAGLSSLDSERRRDLKRDLLGIYILEERNLIQKRKVQWLREGDENTGFFHRVLVVKKRRAFVMELFDVQNNIHLNQPEIEAEIVDFFKTLYSNSIIPFVCPAGLNWRPISSKDGKFKESEIMAVLEEIKPLVQTASQLIFS